MSDLPPFIDASKRYRLFFDETGNVNRSPPCCHGRWCPGCLLPPLLDCPGGHRHPGGTLPGAAGDATVGSDARGDMLPCVFAARTPDPERKPVVKPARQKGTSHAFSASAAGPGSGQLRNAAY
jgi:hypothetical protein